MKKYEVIMPVAGYVVVEVEAEDKEGAIKAAYNAEWKLEDVEELNMYDKIVQGNVVYVSPYQAEVMEIEEE